MRRIILLLIISTSAWADTIEHFMNIVRNIPQMEMKADPQSQAWARSARNILALTSESVAESLIFANEAATRAGKPLFCLPANIQLSPENMSNLIQQTYSGISSQESDKNKMTVSQVAMMGITRQYPCKPLSPQTELFNQRMQHISGQKNG